MGRTSSRAPHAGPWRLLDTPPAPGAWNMAVDEALMESVREGAGPVLRFYRWTPRCLSLGRNQPAAGRYRVEELARRGISVVRRPTGGRAVLHDRELTYAVVAREGELGSPRESYAAVNRGLLAGLVRLGVPASLQPRGGRRAPAPSLAPCFREPAEGEVVAGGRKLVGSAQYREAGVVLQHGSLLLAGGQAEVGALLREAAGEAEGDAPALLEEFLSPLPAWEEFTATLAAGWGEVVGVDLRPASLAPAEAARAAVLRDRYLDEAWTWRR